MDYTHLIKIGSYSEQLHSLYHWSCSGFCDGSHSPSTWCWVDLYSSGGDLFVDDPPHLLDYVHWSTSTYQTKTGISCFTIDYKFVSRVSTKWLRCEFQHISWQNTCRYAILSTTTHTKPYTKHCTYFEAHAVIITGRPIRGRPWRQNLNRKHRHRLNRLPS